MRSRHFIPLIYLKELFPKIKEADFIFINENDNFGIIKTVLDEVGVGFSEKVVSKK